MNVPAQDHFHHHRHGVHVHARHQDGHDRECDRAQRARFRTVAQLQISWDGVGFGDVIEGHHHDAEEEHRRDGADPVPVRGHNAVLIGIPRPAQQFERAQIR